MNDNQLNPIETFNRERAARIESYKADVTLQEAVHMFTKELARTNYVYNFSWLGRPVFQLPQDLFAMQEIIWSTKPDFIIETGIAHGGSLIFYASMMELIGKGKVIGIDLDIRAHNRVEIEKHPFYKRITMIEGSSISKDVVRQVESHIDESKTVLVCLDSNHTHDHVLRELELFTPFVTPGSYCVVFDTIIEDLTPSSIINRPWGAGNNPKTAVWEFLKNNDRFVINKDIQAKLFLTAAPDGYLRCVK